MDRYTQGHLAKRYLSPCEVVPCGIAHMTKCAFAFTLDIEIKHIIFKPSRS